MIAAARGWASARRRGARRRLLIGRGRAEKLTRRVDRRMNSLLVGVPRIHAWTRAADRHANRLLLRVWPPLGRLLRRGRAFSLCWARRAWRLLRPVTVRLFRALAWVERRLLRARDIAVRLAVRASGLLPPEAAICATIVAVAACLVVSQFVDYRAVEIGQPGYAGLAAAEPPTVGAEPTGAAHSYLLLPVAGLAALVGLLAMRTSRRRAENGRRAAGIGPWTAMGGTIFALGALALAVALLVDMPAGLDEGAEASRFSGTTAVLTDGFYAELASAAGLMLGGALLSRKPQRVRDRHRYRPRKPSLARTQGGRRRARTSSA